MRRLSIRDQIDFDYNGGSIPSDYDVMPPEWPVGDLFDDDTYWMDDTAEDAE